MDDMDWKIINLSSDCKILYEKIRKRNYESSRSTAVDEDIDKRSKNDYENCGVNKYPSYAKEEIELFNELQKLYDPTEEITKIQRVKNINPEDNDSGIELEVAGQSDPDSTDCEVLWIKNEKTLEQVLERTTTIGSNVEMNSEVCRKNLEKETVEGMEENTEESNEIIAEKKFPSRCEFCQNSLTSLFDDFERKLTMKINKMISQMSDNYKKHASMSKRLKRNIKNGISIEKNRRSCNDCRKVFTRRQDLFNHYMIVHSDERPHQCKLCPNNYKTTYHLKRHTMNTHRILK